MLGEINQSYFSPYFIFIKRGFEMSDEEILENLGLKKFELIIDEKEKEKEDLNNRYLFLTEDENWTHLMDDWFYTMWHNKEIRNRIKILSKKFEIFTCSVGDSDESFDFNYFKNGKIIRQYIVEDPKYNGGELVKNYGYPFPIEVVALQQKDLYDKVMMMAESFGINIKHQKENIRVYARFGHKSKPVVFNEGEY